MSWVGGIALATVREEEPARGDGLPDETTGNELSPLLGGRGTGETRGASWRGPGALPGTGTYSPTARSGPCGWPSSFPPRVIRSPGSHCHFLCSTEHALLHWPR